MFFSPCAVLFRQLHRHQRTQSAQNVRHRISRPGRFAHIQADHLSGRGLLQRRPIRVQLQGKHFGLLDRYVHRFSHRFKPILGGAQLSARTAQSQMRNAGLPPEHRSRGQRVLEHPARRLETRADRQLHRLRSAVLVPGEFLGDSLSGSAFINIAFPCNSGAQPRGSAQQGGGRRAQVQPAPVRAQRRQGDARQLHRRHVLRVLPQVISKIEAVDMRVLDHPDVGRPHLLHQLLNAIRPIGWHKTTTCRWWWRWRRWSAQMNDGLRLLNVSGGLCACGFEFVRAGFSFERYSFHPICPPSSSHTQKNVCMEALTHTESRCYKFNINLYIHKYI